MLHLLLLCLLARIAYASPAPPAITPSPKSLPELFKRANNVCGSWFDISSTTHYITCNPTVQCRIALTLTPKNIYCSDFGSPVTTAFDYNDWPVDGCGVGQLCCPSTAPYKTRYDYDETDTSSVQIVCGVGSATLINAYGAPFTLEQTEAQSVGGVNTGAVSDLQPAITVSAVTVTPSASSSSAATTTTVPTSSTSSGSAPAATTSKAANGGGGGLAVGSEIGSIMGAICGAIALGATMYFGWKGLERRSESKKEKKMVKEEEEEEEKEKAAQGEAMMSSSDHGM